MLYAPGLSEPFSEADIRDYKSLLWESAMTLRAAIKRSLNAMLPQSAYTALNARVAAKDIVTGRRWDLELKLIAKLIQPGDIVVDAGANHGLYSYHFSKMVGPHGRVHAFEPIPSNIYIFQKTMAKARVQNVTLHREGLSDTNATVDFVVPILNGIPETGCSFHKRGDEKGLVYTCPIRRLDDVLPSLEIAFIKCDVEGGELAVFRGAEGILAQSHPTVFCELISENQAHFGLTSADVVSFFRSIGYSGWRLGGPEGMDLLPPSGDANYLFVHPSRAVPGLTAI
jgi:FkbM family methyltransferase